MHVCVYAVCVYIYVYMEWHSSHSSIGACMRDARMKACLMEVCAPTHTYIYTYIHACIHTYIHTHTSAFHAALAPTASVQILVCEGPKALEVCMYIP